VGTMSENAVPPATEIEFYNDMKKLIPGTDEFVRLYEAPGFNHCAGGPGPQDTPDRLLDKVIAWAEDGKRPMRSSAARRQPVCFPP